MFVLTIAGCGQKDQPSLSSSSSNNNRVIEDSKEKKERTFQPFYVYADKGSRFNHYAASGFMGSTQCLGFNDAWQKECHKGKTCIKIHYDVKCSSKDQTWAGIFWLNPANNWGRRKGGYNLTGAQRLTFWAKGERGGEQVQEFVMGGIEGDFPDSDKVMIGPVILTDQWRKYSIDLRGKDLSFIIGGFGWSSEDSVSQENWTFYLDEIRYE